VVLFVFAVQFLLERPPIESLLFGLALAVAISPELLQLRKHVEHVLVVRTRLPVYRSAPGRLLWMSTAAVAAFALAIPWLPGSDWFEFTPLSPPVLLTVLAITAAYAGASELAKRRFAIP
jgi:cation transport ATPase-like protein